MNLFMNIVWFVCTDDNNAASDDVQPIGDYSAFCSCLAYCRLPRCV